MLARFKIGSGECNHLPLIRHIAGFGKPIIMSTGMQTVETMRPSVQALDEAGIDYALLECTNLYPSPPEIVSLQGINGLRAAFPRAVIGFSDHSIGPSMALASVAPADGMSALEPFDQALALRQISWLYAGHVVRKTTHIRFD